MRFRHIFSAGFNGDSSYEHNCDVIGLNRD
jgi:hypothetical protein